MAVVTGVRVGTCLREKERRRKGFADPVLRLLLACEQWLGRH